MLTHYLALFKKEMNMCELKNYINNIHSSCVNELPQMTSFITCLLSIMPINVITLPQETKNNIPTQNYVFIFNMASSALVN